MPMYTYECNKCGCVKEILRRLVEREDLVLCDNDNETMNFIIGGAPNIRKRSAGLYSLDVSSKKWGDYE